MGLLRTLSAGAAGAAAVTALYQLSRRSIADTPNLDLLAMNAVAGACRMAGRRSPTGANLFKTALIGDIVANTAYYSLASIPSGKRALLVGSLAGLAAGAATALLPGPLGLGDNLARATGKMTAMTIGLYAMGGLAAGATAAAFGRR